MKKIFRMLAILKKLFFVGFGAKSSSANYPEPVVYSATPSIIPIATIPIGFEISFLCLQSYFSLIFCLIFILCPNCKYNVLL